MSVKRFDHRPGLDNGANRPYNLHDIGPLTEQVSRNLKAAGIGLMRLSEALNQAVRSLPLTAAQTRVERPHPPEGSHDE